MLQKTNETVRYSQYSVFFKLLDLGKKEEKKLFRTILIYLRDEIGLGSTAIAEKMKLKPVTKMSRKLFDIYNGVSSGNREYLILICASNYPLAHTPLKAYLQNKIDSILDSAKAEANDITNNLQKLEENLKDA